MPCGLWSSGLPRLNASWKPVVGESDTAPISDPSAEPTVKASEPKPVLSVLWRMLGFSKPYAAMLALSIALILTYSSARYARTYLMKPLLDDVLAPAYSQVVDGQPVDLSQVDIQQALLPGLSSETDAQDEATTPPAQPVPEEQILASLRWIIAVALGLALTMPILLFGRLYLLARYMGRISIDIKNALAAKLLRVPLDFHRGKHSGETLNRALSDATASENAIKLVYGDFVFAGSMVLAGGVTLFAISWQLTLAALITAPFVVGTVAMFARRIRRSARKRQEQLGEVTQRLVDILSGIKVIKAFSGEDLEEKAFRKESNRLFRRELKVVRNRAYSRSLVDFLTGATATLLLALGSWLVLQGMWGITPGTVTAFATALATTYRPVKTLSRGWSKLSEAVASAERFFEVLDMDTEVADRKAAVAIEGIERGITFRDTCLHYGDVKAVDGVNLEVRAGEVIAIVGRSGAGKTTLVDLLLRFHDPTSGSVEIDGRDLRDITRDSLLSQIGIVSQEPFLFDTTIYENIRYGRPKAKQKEVEEAAAIARVDEFVSELPEGYDTEVGEFGLRLSGGQRQRITIARALLKNPAILVFDEATSALDTKTEQTLQNAIDSLRGNRTLFLVAHRLSTIRRADRIVVMDQGRIVDIGSHDELMARPGIYRELASTSRDDAGTATL